MHQHQHEPGWNAPYVVGATMLAAVAVGLAADIAALPWWWPAAAGLAVAGVLTLVAVRNRAHRWRATGLAAWLAGCGLWASWVVTHGWTREAVADLAVSALVAAVASMLLPRADGVDLARPRRIQEVESLLQPAAGGKIELTDIEPWPGRKRDGVRYHLDLNGMTLHALSLRCDAIAGALKLPPGCTVSAEEGPHQGAAVLDVMLRDCLAETRTVEEPTGPASIYDEFAVMHDARGNPVTICLRLLSMVLGGAPDMGKTTLLRRVIMHLARCRDALVWVIDLNGGGLAVPLVEPWARGDATQPVVDWVAGDEYEGAVMIATALAVARDRKTSAEAIRRRREHRTNTLPLDEELPAIVVIGDEGGEIGKATALLGAAIRDGLSSYAQIGREVGGRAIISVLRGTADLLDKGLRIVAAIRVCLTMTEQDEYAHILGVTPPSTRLRHRGSGWIITNIGQRPRLARSADVPPEILERHAVATARYRPRLDARAQQVAAQLTVSAVLGGRDPRDHIDIARHPTMRDVAAGRAYAGRWDRYAPKLAEMRGEEPAPAPVAAPPAVDQPTVAPAGSAREALLLGTGIVADRPSTVDPQQVAGVVATQTRQETTRERIIGIVRDAYPAGLTSGQIGRQLAERGVDVARQTRQDLLRQLVEVGALDRGDGSTYVHRP